jgi:hypothetical protein
VAQLSTLGSTTMHFLEHPSKGRLVAGITIYLLLCVAGCCSLHNPDKLPITFKANDGIRYKLLARVSIEQVIDAENDDARHLHLFNQGLQQHFPDDQKLVDYLQKVDKRYSQMHAARIKELDGIQTDLTQNHGELYLYDSYNSDFDSNYVNTNDPTGAPYTDEGWLILVKGRIYKKY